MEIKEMRKARGLTQKQLADLIGVNPRWVQKVENGETRLENITFLHAIRLVKALSAPGDELQNMQRLAHCMEA